MPSPTLTFSPAMFHAAIVAKNKTVTRRHIQGVHHDCVSNPRLETAVIRGVQRYRGIATLPSGINVDYGAPSHFPGETKPAVTSWAVNASLDDIRPTELVGHGLEVWFNDGTPKPTWAGKTRPGRFLPRTLYDFAPKIRIVSTQPEWLHDITDADALAEGIQAIGPKFGVPNADGDYHHQSSSARGSYFLLWDSLHGPGHAATNPLVWRTEFALA